MDSLPSTPISLGYNNLDEETTNTRYIPRNSTVIVAARDLEGEFAEPRKYRGRYIVWPGLVLAGILVTVSVALIIHFSIIARRNAVQRAEEELIRAANERIIIGDGGAGSSFGSGSTYRNPKTYPVKTCAHPNYVSKNNGIYAEANGKSVRVDIKGVNWSGMETSNAIVYGLWDNTQNGTTVYEIVDFLSRNRFNSVRLPLCVTSIQGDVIPRQDFINTNTNRAISAKSYISFMKSLVKALAFRQITVLLDIHTLDPRTPGSYWYSSTVSEDDLMSSVDILTQELCSAEYWNVLGLDVKNEPEGCTWGTGELKTDFRLAAQRIGNRALKGCKNWLIFVEGVNEAHTLDVDGDILRYSDWWGGGLGKAGAYPVVLSIPNKVVWAPHYYSSSVSPNPYLYQSISGVSFVELTDIKLKRRIQATMNQMFGYLGGATSNSTTDGNAIVLGEFGGLYTSDKHPLKSIQRTTTFTMQEVASNPAYAGGYMWSLNPESGYGYNPGGQTGFFQEGLLQMDWIHANVPYVEALKTLDSLPSLKPFPCL